MKLSELDPPFISLMQPKKVDKLPIGPDWTYELKLDGNRLLAVVETEGVSLFSKSMRHHNDFPPISTSLEGANHELILDGEVVFLETVDGIEIPNLTKLSEYKGQRLRRPDEKIRYFVFDLIYADGKDLRSRPQSERRTTLLEIFPSLPQVQVIDQFTDPDTLLQAVKTMRLEGVVAKRLSSHYLRSTNNGKWQKYKL